MTTSRSSLSKPQTGILIAEVSRLTRALAVERLRSASRLAAIRAALSAAASGESDPLAYLSDQLEEEASNAGVPGSGL